MTDDRLILTAASPLYGASVLALIGSLNLNWPQHPPVLVYDLGLDATTLSTLKKHGITVKKVPEFCPHWRKHFTWKLWCLLDAPGKDVLWIDAGICVLQPLTEIFDALHHTGYFLLENGHSLDHEASDAACKGCGTARKAMQGKNTFAGGLMAFRKKDKLLKLLEEAMDVALVEENIAASDSRHRHEQAIISLLAYKYLSPVTTTDPAPYLAGISPDEVHGQKTWVHRRRMKAADLHHFAQFLSTAGEAHTPSGPAARSSIRRATARVKQLVRNIARKLGFLPPSRKAEAVIYDGVRDRM